jgi:hypothetical protein
MMSLDKYFTSLIERLEASNIQNNGKDRGGFFEPTRAVLLQRLSLLRDLHGKPQARAMVKSAWQYVVEHAPPEWLVLSEEDKKELKKIVG